MEREVGLNRLANFTLPSKLSREYIYDKYESGVIRICPNKGGD